MLQHEHPSNAGEGRIMQHSTAQRGIAQHSTPQHSKAQHGMGQHSTDRQAQHMLLGRHVPGLCIPKTKVSVLKCWTSDDSNRCQQIVVAKNTLLVLMTWPDLSRTPVARPLSISTWSTWAFSFTSPPYFFTPLHCITPLTKVIPTADGMDTPRHAVENAIMWKS